jgi:hypothetical protein
LEQKKCVKRRESCSKQRNPETSDCGIAHAKSKIRIIRYDPFGELNPTIPPEFSVSILPIADSGLTGPESAVMMIQETRQDQDDQKTKIESIQLRAEAQRSFQPLRPKPRFLCHLSPRKSMMLLIGGRLDGNPRQPSLYDGVVRRLDSP